MKKIESKSIGGKARAAKLSPKRRKEIALKASKARWSNPLIKATHGNEHHPLKIGNIEIPCYVLSNGKRVLVQRNMSTALGFAGSSGDRISSFTSGKLISPFMKDETIDALGNPIKFKTLSGKIAHGYEATVLADICESILQARNAEKLLPNQIHIADQCEILVRGFARVGIIALIDEATGYQDDRERNALSRILEAFIAKELQPWIKTFPLSFYKELCRLRGIEFSINLPSYFGHLTNTIVYKRLAPGILEQLKKITPISKKGNKTARYFQSLTLETGYPKLKEHLGSVVTLMKLSEEYDGFINLLDRIHPQYPENVLKNEE